MINLKLNYPSVPAEGVVIRNYFDSVAPRIDEVLNFPEYGGSIRNLNIAAKYLGIEPIYTSVTSLVSCNSGNHALACIFHALRGRSPGIICEPFSYPPFMALAAQNGFKLFPAEFDEHGITTSGLEKAVAETKSKIVYLQPTIQNPTCAVMPLQRRQELASVVRQHGLLIIEDDAYRFLHPWPPPAFLSLIPEFTFHVFSLSKPFNPLIKTCFVALPTAYVAAVTNQVRFTSSGNSALLSDLSAYVLLNKLDDIIRMKQDVARERQQKAASLLNGLRFSTYATSFHLWLELPDKFRSSDVSRRLAELNIGVPPGRESSVRNDDQGEHFIRIALGAEKDWNNIENALLKLRSILE